MARDERSSYILINWCVLIQSISMMNTHTEIHNLAKRGLPENVCLNKHAIMIYKLYEVWTLRGRVCTSFNWSTINFVKRQNNEVGKNILHVLNNKIDKTWRSTLVLTHSKKNAKKSSCRNNANLTNESKLINHNVCAI